MAMYIFPEPNKSVKKLSEEDLVAASNMWGCQLPAIKAVRDVESGGSGFLNSGRPTILFEAHIFSRYTSHQFDRNYPKISSPTWNRKLYSGGEAEYDRLQVAVRLNASAALKSASWGLFQIMGFNYQTCSCKSVEEFVENMYVSEKMHLFMFCEFLKNRNLIELLNEENWTEFARLYNGEGYAKNQYDVKLKKAFAANQAH